MISLHEEQLHFVSQYSHTLTTTHRDKVHPKYVVRTKVEHRERHGVLPLSYFDRLSTSFESPLLHEKFRNQVSTLSIIDE